MRSTLVLIGLCAMLSTPAWADYVLYEDFNGLSSVPTDWEVEDLLGPGESHCRGWDLNTNLIDHDTGEWFGNFTTGDGEAITVDTHQQIPNGHGPFDIALVTPQFSVSAGAELSYYVNYQTDQDGDHLAVEIAIDGSADWSVIADYATDQGECPPGGLVYQNGAWGTEKTHDLSAFAGELVQVRFRYEGPGQELWAQLDNICVTPEPTTLFLLGIGGVLLRRR